MTSTSKIDIMLLTVGCLLLNLLTLLSLVESGLDTSTAAAAAAEQGAKIPRRLHLTIDLPINKALAWAKKRGAANDVSDDILFCRPCRAKKQAPEVYCGFGETLLRLDTTNANAPIELTPHIRAQRSDPQNGSDDYRIDAYFDWEQGGESDLSEDFLVQVRFRDIELVKFPEFAAGLTKAIDGGLTLQAPDMLRNYLKVHYTLTPDALSDAMNLPAPLPSSAPAWLRNPAMEITTLSDLSKGWIFITGGTEWESDNAVKKAIIDRVGDSCLIFVAEPSDPISASLEVRLNARCKLVWPSDVVTGIVELQVTTAFDLQLVDSTHATSTKVVSP